MFSQHESDRDALPKDGQTRRGSTRFKVFFATTLLATLLAATAFQRVVSADALLPVTATALFGMATVIAGLAVLSERRSRLRLAALDAAGVVAAVGIAVSILIEPDQVVRLISLPSASE